MGGAQPSAEEEIIKKAVEMAEREVEEVDEEGAEVAEVNESVEKTAEEKTPEEAPEELPAVLRRIRNEVRWLGLSVDRFNEILKEVGLCRMDEIKDFEEAAEAIKEIMSFFYSNRKRLEEYAGLLKTIERIKSEDPAFDEAMKEAGLDLSFKNLKVLKDFVANYKQPVIEIEMDSDTLRRIARAIVQLVGESRVHFEESGFWMRAVDGANVALVEVRVEGWAVIDYTCPSERVVGVDWESLHNACRLVKGDVKIVVDRELKLIAEDEEGRTRTISLPLISPSEIRKEPKDYSLNSTASVSIPNLKSLVDAHTAFGEAMAIEVADGVARFVTEGDNGRIEDTFCGEGNGKSMYSLEYLQAIAKGLNGLEVKIELADDYPALFEGKDGGVRIRYVLAPRIEAE